jgi:hypothetical protein
MMFMIPEVLVNFAMKNLLKMFWHPSCYSIKNFDQRRDRNQDQGNIPSSRHQRDQKDQRGLKNLKITHKRAGFWAIKKLCSFSWTFPENSRRPGGFYVYMMFMIPEVLVRFCNEQFAEDVLTKAVKIKTTKFLNCPKTRMFRKDKKFLLHMWHPSCYSIKSFDQRRDRNQDQGTFPSSRHQRRIKGV